MTYSLLQFKNDNEIHAVAFSKAEIEASKGKYFTMISNAVVFTAISIDGAYRVSNNVNNAVAMVKTKPTIAELYQLVFKDIKTYGYYTGDITELLYNGLGDAMVHGCNCFNTMGSGIARCVADRFKFAQLADLDTTQGDIGKLGNCSIGYEVNALGSGILVFNAYTQYSMGSDKVHVDYDAVEKVLTQINAKASGLTLLVPMIGCGLAGGDWTIIQKIIVKCLTDVEFKFVFYL